MADQPGRADGREQRLLDALVVLVLLTPVVVASLALPDPVVLVFSALEIGPLWWRRRRPVTTYAVVAAVSAVQTMVLPTPVWGQVAFPLALYAVARSGPELAARAALLVGALGTLAAAVRWAYGRAPDPSAALLPYAVTIGLITALAWTLGTLGRVHAAYDVLRGERDPSADLGRTDRR